jgi:nitroreductase
LLDDSIAAPPNRLNDLSSALALLESRRSAKPRDMTAPGPDEAQIARMLTIASRVPDHGNLAPWRFVAIDDRDAFAALLDRAYRAERYATPGRLELKANRVFAHQAPVLVVAVFCPASQSKVPLWEQQLSIGAVVLNLELAATAQGYVAGWLTGWAAYSPAVARALGLDNPERIAGFIYVGSPSAPLQERTRPLLSQLVRRWPDGRSPLKWRS